MAGRIQVFMDTTEPRPDKGRQAVGADGSSWDYAKSSNIWIDPCTSTVMLQPLPLSAAWKTTFTGNYSRLQKAAFSGTDIAKWRQFSISKSSQDYGLELTQTSTAQLNLTAALSRNQPMFLKYYRNDVNDSTDEVFLVVGYNVGAGGSAPDNFSVQIKFRSNGSVGVYRNGVLDGEYDRSASNFSDARTYVSTFNPAQKWVSVLLIPFRGRELLVWTDNGTSFSHPFSNLSYPNNVDTNPILPAGQFSIVVPNGKCQLQIAKCYFQQSGYAMSAKKTLRYAPAAYDYVNLTSQIYHEYFGLGATFPTLSAEVVDDLAGYPTFVPDGIKTDVRLKVSFTGASGGTNTGLYAADRYWDPPYSSTALGYETNITSAVQSLNLEVNEDGKSSVKITTVAKRLLDLGIAQPTITGDRPFRIRLLSDNATQGYLDIIRGTLSPPEITYLNGSSNFDFAELTFTGSDRMYDFEIAMLQEAIPYDGDSLPQALDKTLPVAGYDPTIYFDTSSTFFYFPQSAEISKANYSFIPKRGDTVAGIIENIKETYFSNWFYGWRPTPKSATGTNPGGYTFCFYNYDAMLDASKKTLWASSFDARVFGGITNTNMALSKSTLRNLKRYYEMPEANQIAVVGADPKSKQLIYSYFIDNASQDPTYTPATRPQNWRGRPVCFIYTDPSINSQDAANSARDELQKRISTGRQLVEWESDFLLYTTTDGTLGANTLNAVWIGDNVKIMNPSSPMGSLTGTITTALGSPNITGVGTAFLTQLAPGDKLYTLDYVYIGTVSTIASNTALTMTMNASTLYTNINYTKIADPVALGVYQVLSLSVNFQKESLTDDNLWIRSAVYRAVFDPDGT